MKTILANSITRVCVCGGERSGPNGDNVALGWSAGRRGGLKRERQWVWLKEMGVVERGKSTGKNDLEIGWAPQSQGPRVARASSGPVVLVVAPLASCSARLPVYG